MRAAGLWCCYSAVRHINSMLFLNTANTASLPVREKACRNIKAFLFGNIWGRFLEADCNRNYWKLPLKWELCTSRFLWRGVSLALASCFTVPILRTASYFKTSPVFSLLQKKERLRGWAGFFSFLFVDVCWCANSRQSRSSLSEVGNTVDTRLYISFLFGSRCWFNGIITDSQVLLSRPDMF